MLLQHKIRLSLTQLLMSGFSSVYLLHFYLFFSNRSSVLKTFGDSSVFLWRGFFHPVRTSQSDPRKVLIGTFSPQFSLGQRHAADTPAVGSGSAACFFHRDASAYAVLPRHRGDSMQGQHSTHRTPAALCDVRTTLCSAQTLRVI